jgi:hypothetical protein
MCWIDNTAVRVAGFYCGILAKRRAALWSIVDPKLIEHEEKARQAALGGMPPLFAIMGV